MFKQVPDGYVFRAPSPWVFGRARFHLVDEAQKAQLLKILTARSPFVFWVALVALIGASAAGLAFGSGHDNPTVTDIVIILGLLPFWIYAAQIASIVPTARRLQPLLAGLPVTDQRITAVDLRKALRKTVSFRQYVVIAAGHAILSAGLILVAFQRTGDGPAQVFANSGAPTYVFAGVVFGISSICFLVMALDKARHKQDDPVPADASFKGILLPVFSLIAAIGLLGLVVMNVAQKIERDRKTALIQERIEKVRVEGSLIRSGQESLKLRTAANAARLSALIVQFNNPTVRCAAATATDDPARLESIRVCRERARQEQDAVQRDIAASRKESEVIGQDNAAMQKQVEAFRIEVDALEAEVKASRR
jgi:hypothetical protein